MQADSENPNLMNKSMEYIEAEGVKIVVDGARHLGAGLGTVEFKREFVRNKVDKWVKDVEELAFIVNIEPRAALSAYNTGLCQSWTFLQRPVKHISDLFHPLEEVIRAKLIPAICAKNIDDLERRIAALPYRYGGLGIESSDDS